MKRIALVNFGNEESYGLLFVGTELKKHGDIRFFDSIDGNLVDNIVDWKPNYICFSPMSTFINEALDIEKKVKDKIDVVSIYGGHHVSNCTEQYGDLTIVGTVDGIDLNWRGRVVTGAVDPITLKQPAREEYYRDIPRLANRYRKIMMSVTGCPFVCTYCSSSAVNTKKRFGNIACIMRRRNMEDIIEEARYIKDSTEEIEWVDDDVFCGDVGWLDRFLDRWISEINLPMYVSTTSVSALKVSDTTLKHLRRTCNCIGMGVQAIRPESLRLLGRAWDNEEQLKKAYDRLTSFGFRVNLQCIVGLPVNDPVEDALDTIDGLNRIGTGSIISCYPLQIYHGTALKQYVNDNGFKLNPKCIGDTNTGLPAIDFGEQTNNRIRNICKLATLAVKYGIERHWIEAMLDIDLDKSTENMSKIRYYECVKDRLPLKADTIFGGIMSGMRLKY